MLVPVRHTKDQRRPGRRDLRHGSRLFAGECRLRRNDDRIAGSLGNADQIQLAQLYKQLNSSVGQFGTDTLVADTAAIRSGTAADAVAAETL
jgi:hypothetical protein